jgi:hypothetical protein
MSSMTLQVEDADQQTLREALHEAHFAKQTADAKLAAAQNALARGEAMVSAAQTEVNRLEGLAHEIATASSERLADLAAGRPVAASPDDGAEDRARVRQVADQRLADSTRALGILQAEVDLAKRDFAASLWNVDVAIGALLCEAGDRVVTELYAAEAIARDLRLQLVALEQISHSPVAGKPDRFKLGARAVRILGNLPLNDDRFPKQGPAHVSATAPFVRDWQRAIDAMRDDPDGSLPGMED